MDFFLQPHLHTIKSYIKDTSDFLLMLEHVGPLPCGTLLSAADVVSLYTNIPNLEAIAAVLEFLLANRQKSWNPKNESLIELLHLVLELNIFQFDGKNYIQVGGTAMGTRVALSLVNIFMAKVNTTGYRC